MAELYQMELEPEYTPPSCNKEKLIWVLMQRVDLALRRIDQLDERLRAVRL